MWKNKQVIEDGIYFPLIISHNSFRVNQILSAYEEGYLYQNVYQFAHQFCYYIAIVSIFSLKCLGKNTVTYVLFDD